MSHEIYNYGLEAMQADPKVSQEEIRRATIASSAAQRAGYLIDDLVGLIAKDLRGVDTLAALIATGTKVLELGLHTKGRLRAAEGRSDAFLEATAANVLTGLREAASIMSEHALDLGAWADAQEKLKPVLDDLKAISGRLERPGVKIAVTPAQAEKPKPEPGPRMFDEDGEPAPAAEMPDPEPAPEKPALPTLGCIDVEVEEKQHPLEGLSDDEQDAGIQRLLDRLEEAGVQEAGLKRKDWKKAHTAWTLLRNNEFIYQLYDALIFALEIRKPISWDVPERKTVEAALQARAMEEENEAREQALADAADRDEELPQAAGE